MNENDYELITMPDEVEEKIKRLSDLDFSKFNKMQWNRLDDILISLQFYIDLYKNAQR